LPPVQDSLDDIGREERQAQYAAQIGLVDLLSLGQLEERAKTATFNQPLPPVRSCERFDDGAVDPGSRRLRAASLG
jgi:hypothetical protein